MAEKFTAKQREIVARKLGYDGPMQGFDNFINSSPALGMKYAAISDKFATRMAKGGMARKKFAAGGAVSDADVKNYLAANPGMTDKQIAAKMTEFKVDPAQMARVTGLDQAAVQSRFNAAIGQQFTDEVMAGAKKIDRVVTTTNNTTAKTLDQINAENAAAKAATAAKAKDVVVTTTNNTTAKTLDQINAENAAAAKAAADKAAADAAAAAAKTTTGTTGDDGIVDIQVIVYGPDGTVYSSPRAAREAGVTNYTTTPPAATGGTTGTITGTPATGVTFSDTGKPQAGKAAQAGVAQIVATPEQDISTANRAGAAETATAGAATATTADAPTAVTTSTYDATQAAANIGQLMAGVAPAVGSLTDENLVKAEQMDPTSTALANMKASQGVAGTVQGAPTRTEQAGEMIAGSAVDQARAEALAAQTAASAAQGVVTEEMTVQGQLNKLMTNFEAGNPPPWAAANLRAVTATLAARGLGASSLAGQALIQATLESALPIASADAQAYQSVAAQNLSNRQQTAVLAAQQRAAFMGQEFDQAFQTRVVNAAKVSDIANMNFTAQQQVALENARLAQTMDLANLSNNQAMVMANAAQIATLETANLNNRQQAAVVNAQSFLQMDMANLSNLQQTTLFRAQQMTQAMLSDTAADNAAKQFNSTSTNQTNQFNTQLSTQVSQFNSAQQNAIAQFNTDQANAIAKFNAEVKNQRETFNAQQRLVIDQANAQWQREIATANTAATNAANIVNAQLSQQMTMAEYNNETQMYRDDVAHAWQSAENDASRATQLAAAEISAAASISAANIKADAEASAATGNFVAKVLGKVLD